MDSKSNDDIFPPNLTNDQINKLKEFRRRVADVLKPDHDNFFLVRWLRARGFDLKKSEDMLRKSMAWRKKWGADEVLTNWKCPENTVFVIGSVITLLPSPLRSLIRKYLSQVLEKYDIGGHCGYDKEGCPVWIYKSANLDMKGISLSCRRNEVIKRYIWKMETNLRLMEAQTEKLGRRVNETIMIDDMQGFTMKHLFQPGMDVILKILGIIEANYPESLKRAYIVNAPSIFPLIFNVCKPFMSEDTKRKVTILGSNWKKELLKVVDADQLPTYWGGTKVDPENGDQYCTSLVRMGGKVPQSFFMKGSDLVDESKVKKMTVEAGKSVRLVSNISLHDISIRYTFWTEAYDIKFGITYKEKPNSKEEVLQKSTKVSCHMFPEDETLQCSKPGIYIFKFDNSFSWFHSKQLSYVIEVIDPEVMSKDPDHTCEQSSEIHLQQRPSQDQLFTVQAENDSAQSDCAESTSDVQGSTSGCVSEL